MLQDDHWDVLDQAVLQGSPLDPICDAILRVARQTFAGSQVAFTVLDRERAVFRSRIEDDVILTRRDHAICNWTITGSQVRVFEDAHANAELRTIPAVAATGGIRFYAGAPIRLNEETLATLCLFGTEPRNDFDAAKRELLASMAAALEESFRLRFDSTERHALRRKANVGSRKLGLSGALAGVGHWRLEPATGEVEWSEQVYEIHGVDPARFHPGLDDALQFYVEEDREMIAAHIERAVSKAQGFTFTALIRRVSDGERRKVMCKADVEIVDGAVHTIFGVFQDITDQDRLLEQVTGERERYRLITQNATDVIATYLPNAVFTYVSPASRAVLGYAPEELVGRKTFSIIHPDDHAGVRASFDGLVAGGVSSNSARIEYRAIHADGSLVWVEAHPRAIYDPAGRLEGFQDVARDVTARKALEADLVAAREAAEAAMRAKSDFLANMSHELRTPLNSIVGFAGLIAQAPELKQETARRASLVCGASRALVMIVDDILEFSKLEAEGVTMRAEPVELDQLLASAVELVHEEATRKGLRLSLEVARTGPAILVDPSRLQQIMLNLLGNAIKFTARGSVTVRLGDDAGGGVRISVRDTGVGIPQDRLTAVFDRFAQADPSTSRRFGGTGLGLAISRTLVDALGGELGVDSEEGFGSTFWFTFDPPVADPGCTPRAASPVGDEKSRIDCRLLLVDDNEVNRDLFCALLADRGLTITQAEDGAEAVRAVQGAIFDVIIMDVQMPVMDGLTATRRIRDLGFADLPIIALTANVMDSQIASCRAAGMNDHLSKPYTPQQVVELLKRWTAADRRGDASDPAQGGRGGRLADLEASLGPQALDRFLDRLAEQLDAMRGFLADPATEVEELARRAHALRGLAGTLGFDEVAQHCAAVETACGGTEGLEQVRGPALRATNASLAEIASRRAARGIRRPSRGVRD